MIIQGKHGIVVRRKEGWIPLTEEIVRQAFILKKKLLVSSKISCDWLRYNTEGIYKPLISNDGTCFLIKPKSRTKGFRLSQFTEDAFCKII